MRVLFRVLVVFVSLIALGELVTRSFLTSPSVQRADDELGWVYIPGAEVFTAKEGGVPLPINARGLNDDEISEKGDRYRALVLGDSFTEALQVARGDNFTSVAERQSKTWDVVNLGRSGLNPAHYPVVFDRYKDLRPEVLIVVVGRGDVQDILGRDILASRSASGAITAVSVRAPTKDRLKSLFAPLLKRSALATYMMRRAKPVVMGLLRKKNPREPGVVAKVRPPEDEGVNQEALDRFVFVLNELKRSADVLLVYIPNLSWGLGGSSSYVSALDLQTVNRAAELAGVTVLDMGPALQDEYRTTLQPPIGFANQRIGFGHLNADGHEAIGRRIGEWLQQFRATSPRPGGAL